MWRYQVFARKLTWYFIGVYIIKWIYFHFRALFGWSSVQSDFYPLAFPRFAIGLKISRQLSTSQSNVNPKQSWRGCWAFPALHPVSCDVITVFLVLIGPLRWLYSHSVYNNSATSWRFFFKIWLSGRRRSRLYLKLFHLEKAASRA